MAGARTLFTDEQLLQDYANSGSDEALTELIGRYRPVLLRLAKRELIYRKDAAADIVQNVLLQLHLNAKKFSETWQKVKPCLHRITIQEARDYLRSQRRHQANDIMHAMRDPHDPQVEESLRELHAAIEGLPERERQVLVLSYFEGQSHREIAEVIGSTEIGTRGLLKRALGRLRILLNNPAALQALEAA